MPNDLDPNELTGRVLRTIAETQRIPLESVTVDKTFADLKIDSLDGINIVFALENEFGISIPDEGVESMRSVQDAVDGVRTLVDQKVSAS
ncbi:MAG TPA: acyl carrier protein [Bryobacteraceae bacterium]|nr:acyl carrier protein [Bryobacteraceae bacterium]